MVVPTSNSMVSVFASFPRLYVALAHLSSPNSVIVIVIVILCFHVTSCIFQNVKTAKPLSFQLSLVIEHPKYISF